MKENKFLILMIFISFINFFNTTKAAEDLDNSFGGKLWENTLFSIGSTVGQSFFHNEISNNSKYKEHFTWGSRIVGILTNPFTTGLRWALGHEGNGKLNYWQKFGYAKLGLLEGTGGLGGWGMRGVEKLFGGDSIKRAALYIFGKISGKDSRSAGTSGIIGWTSVGTGIVAFIGSLGVDIWKSQKYKTEKENFDNIQSEENGIIDKREDIKITISYIGEKCYEFFLLLDHLNNKGIINNRIIKVVGEDTKHYEYDSFIDLLENEEAAKKFIDNIETITCNKYKDNTCRLQFKSKNDSESSQNNKITVSNTDHSEIRNILSLLKRIIGTKNTENKTTGISDSDAANKNITTCYNNDKTKKGISIIKTDQLKKDYFYSNFFKNETSVDNCLLKLKSKKMYYKTLLGILTMVEYSSATVEYSSATKAIADEILILLNLECSKIDYVIKFINDESNNNKKLSDKEIFNKLNFIIKERTKTDIAGSLGKALRIGLTASTITAGIGLAFSRTKNESGRMESDRKKSDEKSYNEKFEFIEKMNEKNKEALEKLKLIKKDLHAIDLRIKTNASDGKLKEDREKLQERYKKLAEEIKKENDKLYAEDGGYFKAISIERNKDRHREQIETILKFIDKNIYKKLFYKDYKIENEKPVPLEDADLVIDGCIPSEQVLLKLKISILTEQISFNREYLDFDKIKENFDYYFNKFKNALEDYNKYRIDLAQAKKDNSVKGIDNKEKIKILKKHPNIRFYGDNNNSEIEKLLENLIVGTKAEIENVKLNAIQSTDIDKEKECNDYILVLDIIQQIVKYFEVNISKNADDFGSIKMLDFRGLEYDTNITDANGEGTAFDKEEKKNRHCAFQIAFDKLAGMEGYCKKKENFVNGEVKPEECTKKRYDELRRIYNELLIEKSNSNHLGSASNKYSDSEYKPMQLLSEE